MIPKDPVMLLSYVNTQLRDFYSSLDALCEDKGIEKEDFARAFSDRCLLFDPASEPGSRHHSSGGGSAGDAAVAFPGCILMRF